MKRIDRDRGWVLFTTGAAFGALTAELLDIVTLPWWLGIVSALVGLGAVVYLVLWWARWARDYGERERERE